MSIFSIITIKVHFRSSPLLISGLSSWPCRSWRQSGTPMVFSAWMRPTYCRSSPSRPRCRLGPPKCDQAAANFRPRPLESHSLRLRRYLKQWRNFTVRQKLFHSFTLLISHSLTLYMQNNFCFQCFVKKYVKGAKLLKKSSLLRIMLIFLSKNRGKKL